MAGQTLTLTIASQLQKAGFTEAAEQMRKLQSEVDGTTKKSEALGDIVTKLKGAFTVGAIVAFYKSAVDEASRAEQTQLRLKTALESTGLSWQANQFQIKEFNTALAASSRFAKGDLDDALQIMIQRTNSLSVSQANLQTVMGISVATGRTLADVADQVGRAANGSQRDIARLAKEFGITGDAAKNAEAVLNTLDQRFGKLATSEQTAEKEMARLFNNFNDFKEDVGGGALPVINEIIDGLIRFGRAIRELVSGGLASQMGVVIGVLTLDKDLIKQSWQEVKDAVTGAWEAMANNDVPTKVAATGSKTTAAAQAMSDDLKKIMQDLNAEAAKINDGLGKTQLEKLTADTELQKAEIRKRADFAILTAQDQARVIEAIELNSAAKRRQIELDTMKTRLETAVRYANVIGAATGKMLTGDRDAWKDASRQIIDMIVAQAQAAIIARSMAGAAAEVAKHGVLGLATGAGLIAWGAAQAAAVAAVGEIAKSALTGGGNVSAPSAGGAGGGASVPGAGESVGSAATAAPAQASTTVRVNIMGDMYGEPTFIDNLARKISEAVENRDVRMVSTTIRG